VLTDDGEPAEIISLGIGRLLQRTMRISFVAHVKAASGYSAQLNQILKELEVAIAGASLGGAKYASLVEVRGARGVRGRRQERRAPGLHLRVLLHHGAQRARRCALDKGRDHDHRHRRKQAAKVQGRGHLGHGAGGGQRAAPAARDLDA
jgi:hypothetical protein